MSNATTTGYYNDSAYMRSPPQTWYCLMLPYCNTTGCDTTEAHRPVSCPDCKGGIVALLFVVLLVMSIFITLGNMGIILVIIKNPKFHNPFNMFKCSLAVADLLVGILVIPCGIAEAAIILMTPFDKEEVNSGEVHIVTSDSNVIMKGSLCARIHDEESSVVGFFMSIVGVLSIMASIFNLVLLSVDRFLAVSCPVKYRNGRAINNRMAAFLIALVWAICIILSALVPTTMGPDYFRFGLTTTMMFTLETQNGYTGFFYALFTIGLPYLIMVGLNTGTALLLFRRRAKVLKRTTSLPNFVTNSRKSSKRSEVKAAITLLVMVLVFTICTIPHMIAVMLYNDRKTGGGFTEGHTEGIVNMLLGLLIVSNSAWNFIIYSWRSKNFRKTLRKIVLGAKGKSPRIGWERVKLVALRRRSDKRQRKQFADKSTSRDKSSSEKNSYTTAEV